MTPRMEYFDAAWTERDWAAARSACLHRAQRVLSNDADAQDAVQEAMTRAWRKRSECRDDAVHWMLQITHNEALRIVSRRRAHAPLEEAPEPAEPSPADAIVERIVVREALAGLPERDRSLLEMRYADCLTQLTIADRAGLPEGTVKVRLHRLRNQLRSAFQEAP